MGCNFKTHVLDGTLEEAEVRTAFDALQDIDRYENGHSYSGGFGMATGLTFKGNTFDDADQAHDWLDQNTVKWEDALCVKFKDGGSPKWMIAAQCAS